MTTITSDELREFAGMMLEWSQCPETTAAAKTLAAKKHLDPSVVPAVRTLFRAMLTEKVVKDLIPTVLESLNEYDESLGVSSLLK